MDNTLYGVPKAVETLVLIYNKDLFDQAGVAYPTNDWTWADADAAALKIKALDVTSLFYQEVRRYFYVTPTQYLQLLTIFQK